MAHFDIKNKKLPYMKTEKSVGEKEERCGSKEVGRSPHTYIIKRKNPLPEKMGSEQLNVVRFGELNYITIVAHNGYLANLSRCHVRLPHVLARFIYYNMKVRRISSLLSHVIVLSINVTHFAG